jgi:2-amino-4-hydroxy-6-hydroxymethyldihydropteridine diphosphokinase
MHILYLALGTNLGDRLSNIKNAIAALPPVVQVTKQSSVYETPPWGYADQPEFLNMALRAETELEPSDLLSFLKNLEEELGRVESFRYGPRQIDLDILFYDDLVLETSELIIPHPKLHERAFVLVPLAEIAPALIHPLKRKSVSDLLRDVKIDGIHKYIDLYPT